MSRFTIAGAGLAGSLMALYLARRGHQVDVYERRPDMRRATAERGRSINLAISLRGLSALAEVGLEQRIMDLAIPMPGRMIHDRQGGLHFQRYSIHPGEAIYSVSRTALNCALLDACDESQAVTTRFEHRCTGLDLESRTASFEDGHGRTLTAPAPLVAADGAFSVVRAALQRRDRFDSHQDFLDWGYKELTMPALPGGDWAIDKNALHIWPRHEFMLIALPNLDGSFTCTMFLPFEGPHGFAGLDSDDRVQRFFTEQFPDAVPLMPTLLDDFRHNPTSSLAYIRCFPWHVADQVVMVGDACHAVVPFYGQGMNAAFEDCSVLAACLDRHQGDLDGAFSEYERLRKPDTDALADLALANFLEMRSKVADWRFLLKDRADKWLGRLFPNDWIPLYSMVTFSRLPYAAAVVRARRQDRILAALGVAIALALAAALATGMAHVFGHA